MALPITALYGGILAVFMLVLASRSGLYRTKVDVSVGDGGNPQLLERMRVHGNAVEYVPMLVILMAVLEANGASNNFLHAVGVLLIAFRLAHAKGLKADNIKDPLRAIGAGGTALLTLVMGAFAIWQFIGTF